MSFKKKLTNQVICDAHAPKLRSRGLLISRLRAACLLALLTIFTGPLLAQPKIVLQTTPGPTEIPLQAASNVIIDPLSGDITATPADPAACTATGSGDCDAQVDVISFSVNPSTVSQGQSFTATFSQRGAWECERTGLPGTTWNTAWAAPGSGQLSVLVGSAISPDSYTLTLTCRNGTSGGQAIDSLSRGIVVTAGGGGGTPQSCIDSGRVPPSTWQRETNADVENPSNTTLTWTQMFGGSGGLQFPEARAKDVRVRSNRYAAFSFNTGTAGLFGQVTISDPFANVGLQRGPVLVSMSPCPGDFKPQTGTAALCRRPSVGGLAISAFPWTRNSAAAAARCLIPPNTDYYFNVTFTDEASWSQTDPQLLNWQCNDDFPTSTCAVRMSVLNTF